MAKLLLLLLLLTVTVHLCVSQAQFQSRLFPAGKADNPSQEEPLERALRALNDWAQKENLQTRALAAEIDKRDDLGFPAQTLAKRGLEKREGLGFPAETSRELEEEKRGGMAEEKRGGEVDASYDVKKALYRRLQDDAAGENRDNSLKTREAANPAQGGWWPRHGQQGGWWPRHGRQGGWWPRNGRQGGWWPRNGQQGGWWPKDGRLEVKDDQKSQGYGSQLPMTGLGSAAGLPRSSGNSYRREKTLSARRLRRS